MANHFQLKLAFCFLVLCTTSMFFYVGNLTGLDNGSGGAFVEVVTYEQTFLNFSNYHANLDRLLDLDRQTHLQKMCYLNTASTRDVTLNKDNLDHILVDEKHRLLYCYVPKVACTNWKRIFMILTGKTNTTDATEIPASVAHGKGVFTKLSNYSVVEINHFLKYFTKFLFVRHPFERLLSAYRNKLEQRYLSSKYFQLRFGRHIVKHYRKDPSQESLINGNDVTFYEFVTYLTNPVGIVFNEHWNPIYQLCHPCLINYDIIGKYETLYHDSDYILNLIGESGIVFPRSNKPSSTSSNLPRYFAKLPKQMILKLYEIYVMDFKLFGYNLNGFLDSG